MLNDSPLRARPRIVLLAVLPILFFASLLVPAVAGAVTIDYVGGVVEVTGTEGSDDVNFANAYDDFSMDDTSRVRIYGDEGSSVTPAAAAVCTDSSSDENIWEPDVWHCPRPSKVVVSLLGGDDFLSAYENGDVPFTVSLEGDGGAGDDRLDGGTGNDIFHGGAGNDELTGRDGDDRVYGQEGNDHLNGDFGESGPGGDDLLDGGPGDDEFETYVGFGYPAGMKGADTYIGGPGNDKISYFHRSEPLRITLDGVANDGAAGEGDNLHPDLEEVGGGSGNDVMVGSPGNDVLWGSDGDDKISGGAGNDKLQGNEGDDVIDGGRGNDELDGGCMTDVLVGGPGRDTFNSDGTCQANLRSTFDEIHARDGEPDKLIFCQRDNDPAGDTAVVDPTDPVTNKGAGACKNILVGTLGGGKGVPKGKVRAKLGSQMRLIVGTGKKGSAAPQRIELKRKRLVLGTIFAPRGGVVTVTASTRKGRRTITIGKARVKLAKGGSKQLVIKLSGKARSAVKKRKKAAVKVTFKIDKKRFNKNFRVPVKR